jgi:hypothetical protein
MAPLKIKFARGALQSKITQMYKWAKPAKSDEVKIYIKASSNSTVLIMDLKTSKSSQALMCLGRARAHFK